MMVGHSYLSAAWTRACVQYLFISPRTDGAGQGKGAGSDGRGFERGLSCPQPRQSSTVPCGVFGGGAVGGGERDLQWVFGKFCVDISTSQTFTSVIFLFRPIDRIAVIVAL